jgi:hypothetical protein
MNYDRIYTTLDFARIGDLVITVGDNGNGNNFVTTISTGQYWAGDLTYASITGVAAAIESALDADDPDGTPWTVAYNNNTMAYAISSSLGNSQLTFEPLGANLLGLPEGPTTAGTHTSSNRPYYIFAPSVGYTANTRPFRHPGDGIVSTAVTLDGTQYGVATVTRPVHFDFEQQLNPTASVFKYEAASSEPWTLEHLFEHVGCHEQVLLIAGTDAAFSGSTYPLRFYLRDDGAAFDPYYHEPDVNVYYGVPFRCQVLERNTQ